MKDRPWRNIYIISVSSTYYSPNSPLSQIYFILDYSKTIYARTITVTSGNQLTPSIHRHYGIYFSESYLNLNLETTSLYCYHYIL